MAGLFLLIIRRSLRNAPLTLAVLVGLLVLVTLLVAAPLYTTALADIGLRATLADAPLDQRSIRIALPADHLQQASHARLGAAVSKLAAEAPWLKPSILTAIRTKRLIIPGSDLTRRVVLVEADTASENLRTIEGRLPQPTADGAAIEVVLGTTAAEQFGVSVGDTLPLTEREGGEQLLSMQVVGLVEPANAASTFWQSGVIDLEPVVSTTRREAMLLVAPGVMWQGVVPRLPSERASGEYRWRIVFDTSVVDGKNAIQAENDIRRILHDGTQTLPGAEVASDFGGIVSGYQQRLAIARAPILLLLSEIAGLALIYLAWTAAFQAEATAGEQAVMGARGAGVGQILAISSVQSALLALGAALAGIPLALLLLRATANFGPVADLARAQGLRLTATPDTRIYAASASLIGLLALALPAIPAARRSIVALRHDAARPARLPLWQRTGLDLFIIVIALVAFFQLQRQGSVLQQLRGKFEVDPFLVIAPLLVLVAGGLLFLRLYPLLLRTTRGLAVRMRGLPLALALLQLSRSRAASTRLVLLLSLALALGLFAETFGATLALNQRQRAGYVVGADARATLNNTEPLLPGTLPPGVQGSWALRDTIKAAGGRGAAGTLLAIDPAHFKEVAFNPPQHPILALDEALARLGPPPEEDGIVLPKNAHQVTLTIKRNAAPLDIALLLRDNVGNYYRPRMTVVAHVDERETFEATLNVPAVAYPVRLVSVALLPNSLVRWGIREGPTKPPVTVELGPIVAGGITIERWDGATPWDALSDSSFNLDQPAAGTVDLEAGQPGWQPLTITIGQGMRAALVRPNPVAYDPIRVEVNEAFLRANNLETGATGLFLFHNRLASMEIVGILPRFPSLGIDDAPFMVAHGPRLLRLLNASYARPITPNELWLDLPDDPATIQRVRTTSGIGDLLLQTTVLRSFSRDPLAIGIAGVFFLGFVSSVGLTAIGFGIATYLAGKRRTIEFAVLRALGLERKAVLLTLAVEQAVLVLLALLAGTLLGVALSRLILPFMAVSDRGHAVVPPYQIIVPWSTLFLTYCFLLILFASVTTLVISLLLRRGIGTALRIGEE